MAVRFRCNRCDRRFSVADEMAGKMAQCRQCGNRMRVPVVASPPPVPSSAPTPPRPQPVVVPAIDSGPEIDAYGFDEADDDPIVDLEPVDPPPRASGGRWPARSTGGVGTVRRGRRTGDRSGRAWRLVFALMFLSVGIGGILKHYEHAGRPLFRSAAVARHDQLAESARNNTLTLDGPIQLPAFPDPGPAREIEPGVVFREVVLGPPRMNPDAPPGHCGKLWVYLPGGDHPARSLPCVLITGAGTNLITGAELGESSRPEHLPYVRAGFAVVAFEQDGAIDDPGNATGARLVNAALQFLRARAGLVNAHIALEYALRSIPEVDPERVMAAGHSSAGTMAVLFAENETRLKACVAYAPALHISEYFDATNAKALDREGLGALIDRFSPHNALATIGCPLFLFHAEGDTVVGVAESRRIAASLQSQGKSVTLDVVPGGDHYQSMIDPGIPHAIAWLKATLNAAGPGR